MRPSTMRLATFNILHGRAPSDGVVDLSRLGEAVRSLDADILGLQEVDRDQPRSHLADLTAVAAEAMGATSYHFAPAMAGTPGVTRLSAREAEVPGTAAYGIALISRYPVRSWEVRQLPQLPFRVPILIRQTRRLVMVTEEPRAVLIAHIDTPVGPLVVANTHLSFVPGWGRRQLVDIRRALAKVGGPAVLMGDFNLAGRLPARISGFRALASHPTFPVERPRRQIDHILLRGRLGTVRHTAAPRLALSDHRPLVVELDLDEV